MLFVDKERLEGLKHNIGFRERGRGTQGNGIGMFTVHKRPFYRSVSTRLSLIVAMITVHFNYPKRRFDIWKLLPCRTDGLNAVNKLKERNIVLDGTILSVKQTGDKIFA